MLFRSHLLANFAVATPPVEIFPARRVSDKRLIRLLKTYGLPSTKAKVKGAHVKQRKRSALAALEKQLPIPFKPSAAKSGGYFKMGTLPPLGAIKPPSFGQRSLDSDTQRMMDHFRIEFPSEEAFYEKMEIEPDDYQAWYDAKGSIWSRWKTTHHLRTRLADLADQTTM